MRESFVGADVVNPLFKDTRLDLPRMRRDRHGKIRDEMGRHGIDAALLLGQSNVEYATGAQVMPADAERGHLFPTTALVVAADEVPHIYTPYPEGAPLEIPDDHVHEALCPNSDRGVEAMAGEIQNVLDVGGATIAVDDYTAPMHMSLPRLLSRAKLSDAGGLLSTVRMVKTLDEIECIRRATRINEIAMYDVQWQLRPGLRESDLFAHFTRRIFEYGDSATTVAAFWQVMSKRAFTPHGDVPFSTVPTDHILSEGEVLWVDSAISYKGYKSDFGRTWIASLAPRPNKRQKELFERWWDVTQRVRS
jgi:Xaa-Pro aminopeptidase